MNFMYAIFLPVTLPNKTHLKMGKAPYCIAFWKQWVYAFWTYFNKGKVVNVPDKK